MFKLTIVEKYNVTVTLGWHDSSFWSFDILSMEEIYIS